MVPQHLHQAGRRAAADQSGPAAAQERPRQVAGSLRVALKGFLKPGVILKPARDLLPEGVDFWAAMPGHGTFQHWRQPVVAGLSPFDEQAPFMQSFEIIGFGCDRDTLKERDVDARCQRCDRQDLPG